MRLGVSDTMRVIYNGLNYGKTTRNAMEIVKRAIEMGANKIEVTVKTEEHDKLQTRYQALLDASKKLREEFIIMHEKLVNKLMCDFTHCDALVALDEVLKEQGVE